MRATIRFAAAAAILLICGGCFRWSAPVKPPMGFLYTHYRAPLTADATDFSTGGGEGKSHSLAIREPLVTGQGVAWADAAVEAAARDGGLTEVDYADYEMYSVLSVYSRFTVHVYGR